MRSLVLMLALAGCGSGGNISAKETCTQAVCPLGGHTYQFCTSAQASACRYLGSDNSTFQCKSCGDCTAAANQIGNWCSTSNGSTSGSTTSGSTTGGPTSGSTGSTTGTTLLNGCNGLINCYVACNSTGGAQSCFDDCDAGGTQQGLDLLNAYGSCIDTNCFQANDLDSGTAFCTDATVSSAECQSCYNRILSSGGVCYSAETSCANDKP